MQSKWKVNEIFDSTQNGFFSLDWEWRFTYINHRVINIPDKEPEELIGKVLWEESPDIMGTPLETVYRKAMKFCAVQRIEIMDVHIGSWYNITIHPTSDGISIYWQDITEHKQVEEVVKESAEKYKKILNSIDQGFFLIDVIFDDKDNPVDMYYVEANEAATRILGFNYTGKHLKEIDPNYESYWFKIFGEVALTGKSVRLENYAEPDKKWYSYYLFRIGGENSRRIGNIFLDITDRKHTEKALSESEERFRVIVDAVAQAVWEADDAGVVVTDSLTWRAYTGQTLEEWLGNGWAKVIHPRDREYVQKQWHKAVAAGSHLNEEFLIRGANGEWKWTNVHAAPIHDSEGKIVKWVGISIDISERKRAEELLNESEEKLRTIFENSRDGINMLDLTTGKYVYMSPAQVEMTGFTEDEINNISAEEAYERVHPEDRNISIEQQRLLVTGLRTFCEVEYRWKVKNGHYRWFEDRRKIVHDDQGQPTAIVGISRDITKKKQNEEALRKSEEKYHILFNSIDEGFCIIEVIFDAVGKPANFRYLKVNRAFEKQSGIQNAVGKCIRDLVPDLEEEWFEIYGKVALTGEPIRFQNESKVLNCWYSLYAFRVGTQDKGKVAVLFKDITDEVKAKNKIEESLKMQEEFFINVSHELKTPLSIIYSATQLMEVYLKKNSNDANQEKVFNNIDTIKQSCYRLTKLINNIMDLSKMETGFFELKLSNENIVQVVKNIVHGVSGHTQWKRLSVIFNSNSEEKIIAIDADKIERVVLNLISNAIKFSDSGNEIHVNVTDQGEWVQISVQDHGIGIDKEHMDRLFQRFYQADKSLHRNAEGTGIGLSIVKSIVDMLDGKINVESEVGKGSTFKIDLPARTIDVEDEKQEMKLLNDISERINIEFSDID